MTLWERVDRLSHPAPPPLNTIGPPTLPDNTKKKSSTPPNSGVKSLNRKSINH